MDNPISWCILTDRYGADIRSPSQSQLVDVVRQLFRDDLPATAENDAEEHAMASVRYGFDDGPLFIIEGSRSHTVTVSKFADADFEQFVSAVTLRDVSEVRLVQLWFSLVSGDTKAIEGLLSAPEP